MFTAIGAGIAALAGIGAGVGIGIATGKAVEDIRSTMLIGAALAEATAVYGFVVAVLIILLLGA